MVLIPRAAPAQVPANPTNTRLSPPSRVVSYAGNAVDELPGGASVNFESAAFGFRQDEPASFDRDGGREQQFPSHHSGRINAPSQTFAAMLEDSETAGGKKNAAGDGPAAPFPGVVARAIEIYETNAKIVSGESNILGTSVSLVL